MGANKACFALNGEPYFGITRCIYDFGRTAGGVTDILPVPPLR